MALACSLQISLPSLHPPTPKLSHQIQTPPPFLYLKRLTLSLSLSTQSKPTSTPSRTRFVIRATENGAQTENEPQQTTEIATADGGSSSGGGGVGSGGGGGGRELSELGMEIKKAMKEREKEGGGGIGDLLSGVVEEIGEIEWPDFGKVLGTTGVVLGVIAGSSVVLLTLNAVLAELSDRVFAGKGVQDFFAHSPGGGKCGCIVPLGYTTLLCCELQAVTMGELEAPLRTLVLTLQQLQAANDDPGLGGANQILDTVVIDF
ncbi:hypothetical protein Cgig2_011049 [Carnegiea gigantea]|uniref:Uncharacterized protein n=1 Tax=Carnegiea gigantea TaxID=171969 RepID=A0A9Q1KH51_9CARY|nr:hypothetical protein Cgig2_011049 [Carnegiea gigantea]